MRTVLVLALLAVAASAAAQTERPPLTVAEFEWIGSPLGQIGQFPHGFVAEGGSVAATARNPLDGSRPVAGRYVGGFWNDIRLGYTSLGGISTAGVSGTAHSFTGAFLERAFRRSGGILAPHSDGFETEGGGINRDGTSTGRYYAAGDRCGSFPYRWTDSTFVVLDQIPDCSEGIDINDAGTIVATHIEDNAAGTEPMVLIDKDGTVAELPRDGHMYWDPTAINNAGHVVGEVVDNDLGTGEITFDLAFFWDGATYTYLPMLPDDAGYSRAEDVNDFDQIVGYSRHCGTGRCDTAVLWQDGETVVLENLAAEKLAAGSTLDQAQGISNDGWIVGYGRDATTNRYQFFRLRLGVPSIAATIADVNRFGGAVGALGGVSVSLADGTGATVSTTTSEPNGRARLPLEDLDEGETYTLVLDDGTLRREYAGVTLDALRSRSFRLPVTLRAASVAPLAALASTSLFVLPYSTHQVADLLAEWDASGARPAQTWDDRDEAFGRLVSSAQALAEVYAGTQPLADEAAAVTVSAIMSALALRKAVGEVRQLAETAVTAAADNVLERAGLLAVGLMLQAAELGAGQLQDAVVSGLKGVLPGPAANALNSAANAAVKGGTSGLESGRWDQAAGRKAFVTQLVASLSSAIGGSVLGNIYVAETDLDFRLAIVRSRVLFGEGDVESGFADAMALAAEVVADNETVLNASQAVRSTAEGWATVADVSLLVGRIPAAQVAALLGGIIKGVNVAGLVAVGAADYVRFYGAIEETPPVVERPYVSGDLGGGGDEARHARSPLLRAPQGPAADAYAAAVEGVRTAVLGGDAETILTEGETMLGAERPLDVEIDTELRRLEALAPSSGPTFADLQRVALARAGILAGERLALGAAVAGLLVPDLGTDPDGPSPDLPAEYAAYDGDFAAADSALAAAPRVLDALDALRDALDAAFAEAGGAVPPFVVVLAHGADGHPDRRVEAGVPFVLEAQITNVGDVDATNVVARLVIDGDTLGAPTPVLHLLSPDSQSLGTLAAGVGRTVRWDVVGRDTSAVGTAGVYDVVVTADDAADGAVGILSVAGPETTFDLVLDGADGWRLMAAALPGQTYDTLLSPLWTQGAPGADVTAGAPTVFRYDESTPGSIDDGFVPVADLGVEVPLGSGFAVYVFRDDDPLTDGVQGDFPKTLRQSGARLTDPLAFPVTYTPTDEGDPSATADDDGWNLLGNPFDASLAWELLQRTAVEDAVYVFDPALPGYRVWVDGVGDLADGLVAPNQAFWAKATGAGAALTAPLLARGPVAPFHGRREAPVALGVEATAALAGATRTARAWLTFDAEATAGHDARDAFALDGLAPDRLALALVAADGTPHAIDARPAGTVEIPVVLDAVTSETGPVTVTLRWDGLDRLPADWPVTLVDGDRTVDLRATPTVTVTVTPEAAGSARLGRGPASRAGDRTPRLFLRVGAGPTPLDGPTAEAFGLDAPAPNPTARRAVLRFHLAEAGPVRLALYDVLGREVAVLADGVRQPGAHEATLDASALAAGVYVLRLQAGPLVATRTLTIAR